MKNTTFKKLSKEEQNKKINEATINFIVEIEKEKLYFFMLLLSNPCKVVCVKSPEKKAIKEFLGYEWSDTKGNEGIKYINVQVEKSEDEEEADDTIEQIKGINGIQTPLFNPKNFDDVTKINTIIRSNFEGKALSIPEHLAEFVKTVGLVDMIDFSRASFDKAIRTNVTSESGKLKIESKWPLVKLGEICKIINPSKTAIHDILDDTVVSFVDMASISNDGYIELKTDKFLGDLRKGSYSYFAENDIIIAKITPCMENGKCAIAKKLTNGIGMGSSEFHVFRIDNKYSTEYVFAFLNRKKIRDEAEKVMTGSSGHRRVPVNFYKDLLLPLPPLDIQQNIVDECEAVDKEYEEAQDAIVQCKNEISSIMENVQGEQKKLGEVCDSPMYGANVAAKEGNPQNDYRYIRITDIDDDGNLNSDWKTAEKIEAKYILKEGDVLFARSGATAGKTFLYTNNVGKAIYAGYLIKFTPKNTILLPKYLIAFTHSRFYLQWAERTRGGTAQPNINAQQYSALPIPVPPLAEQQRIVEQITALEQQIAAAKKTIADVPAKKQAILDRWL